ncbi:MAG TPA: phosphoglycerate dehydrogenase [Brevundimonas sp.]|nr:phosphoglycerate dehydrogenase [Brevundimonas sp.]
MNAPLSHPPKTDLKPDAGTTPVMAQYLSVKAGQPDAMLFFRMGDFYELFFEDAQKAAAALGIALTKRGKHQGEDIPMAGVPVHAMDGYLARLIRQGFKVAVCEQLEDPAEARKRGSKAVVHRDIVRVVTPGTLTEDTLLDARGANRLAAVAIRKGRAAVAVVELSAGVVDSVACDLSDLGAALAAFRPSEVLVPDRLFSDETMKGALDEDDLIEAIKGVHVLGIRSKTNVSRKVLDAADRLMAVAAFCIGTNQVDLDAAADKGVAVFNAPYSNTRSVVELAIGMMIVLMRDVADKSREMHKGVWNKSATGSREVRGKTLGIVGYGAIGSQLSVLAENLGMRVLFYDLSERLALGNARRMRSLDALLAEADVVTLHVDGRKENTAIIGADQFARMKPGALFLNLSRGHVVDVDAMAAALKSGRLGGAAVDVFPEEPRTNADPFDSPLVGLDKTILTPHIGGSTEEAQEAIAEFAAERLLGYLNRGDTTFCVNLPNVQLAEVTRAHRLLHIHRNQPGVLAELNRALSDAGLNILGQHLKTDERTGYVITDVDRDYDREALTALKQLPGTIRFRRLH